MFCYGKKRSGNFNCMSHFGLISLSLCIIVYYEENEATFSMFRSKFLLLILIDFDLLMHIFSVINLGLFTKMLRL